MDIKYCFGNGCRFYQQKPDAMCFNYGVLPRCSPELKQQRKLLDAAAPEMYEALKNRVSCHSPKCYWESHTCTCGFDESEIRIKQALAKVEKPDSM